MKTGNAQKSAIGRIIIGVFCTTIGLCVLMVMLNMYDPTRNTIEALSSVCMDVICIIIIFILVCSFAFDNYGSNRTTRLFAGLLIATIWALFTDFLNWAFDGLLEFWQMTFWFTVGSLCMGSVLACLFSLYLYSYMDETHNLGKMKKGASVCAAMNIVSFVLTFGLAMSGTAFQFVDGHYETGVLYDVITVIPVLSMFYLIGYIIWNVKSVGVHDVFAVSGYIVFMVAGALIEARYGIGTTYVAVSIADIFIFVMMQNEIIAQAKRNVMELTVKSNTDELTGFYNRHAYEDDLAMLQNNAIPDDFVYVSMDVNALKKVNDSQGHNAGDELLMGAAECLEKCFGKYGKLYRTGGDEFIALVQMNDEQIKESQRIIEEVTKKWDGKLVHQLAVSCGYVALTENPEMTIRQMADLADKRMYEAKNEFYRRTGLERRRR